MPAVIDASALAEYLVSSPVGVRVRSALEPHGGALHIPHLAVVETVSVLRSWVRRGALSLPRAEAALTDLSDLRWPADPRLTTIRQLRQT